MFVECHRPQIMPYGSFTLHPKNIGHFPPSRLGKKKKSTNDKLYSLFALYYLHNGVVKKSSFWRQTDTYPAVCFRRLCAFNNVAFFHSLSSCDFHLVGFIHASVLHEGNVVFYHCVAAQRNLNVLVPAFDNFLYIYMKSIAVSCFSVAVQFYKCSHCISLYICSHISV